MNTLKQILTVIFAMRPVFANVAAGVHEGGITKTLEQAAASRHLLGKAGSASDEVDLCGASDRPMGVITDEGDAGDPVNISLLGVSNSTQLMVASEPITAGSPVYTAANGQVQNQPTVTGDYYLVGFALTAAASAGEQIEVQATAPRHVKLITAFTGTAGTDIAALGAALEDGPDQVIVLA